MDLKLKENKKVSDEEISDGHLKTCIYIVEKSNILIQNSINECIIKQGLLLNSNEAAGKSLLLVLNDIIDSTVLIQQIFNVDTEKEVYRLMVNSYSVTAEAFEFLKRNEKLIKEIQQKATPIDYLSALPIQSNINLNCVFKYLNSKNGILRDEINQLSLNCESLLFELLKSQRLLREASTMNYKLKMEMHQSLNAFLASKELPPIIFQLNLPTSTPVEADINDLEASFSSKFSMSAGTLEDIDQIHSEADKIVEAEKLKISSSFPSIPQPFQNQPNQPNQQQDIELKLSDFDDDEDENDLIFDGFTKDNILKKV